MISRCPSCGAPAPDAARKCPGCGWDFVNNKKGVKQPDLPKKVEPPNKAEAPPAAGFSLPPARGGASPERKPAEPDAALARADENPFALPVARNLSPKPGESLFAPPAKAPAPEPAETKKAEPPPKKEPPPEEPPSIFSKFLSKPAPKPAPKPLPPPEPEPVPDEPEENSAALLLPTSTKEIVVEIARRPGPKEPAIAAKKPAGRQSAVYLAALAGGALGLLSIGVIYVMLRSGPKAAARPTGSSPFGKRSLDDAGLTPNLDEPELPVEAPAPAPEPSSPAPLASIEAPPPTSLPAPAMSRAIEPPSPVEAPKPIVASPPPALPFRPTAVFAAGVKPKPAAVPKPKPKPAAVAAPKKPAGPQWVFEGIVYDLLSTRGAYGVRLVFVDSDDNEVASVETAEDGGYRAAMKPGPAQGYALRIQHDDYSGKHIDELDSTSSVRKADLEQRKFLIQAGARRLPWIGQTGKPIRRDMALVPKAVED